MVTPKFKAFVRPGVAAAAPPVPVPVLAAAAVEPDADDDDVFFAHFGDV